jgi:hypothetical protein
LEAKKMDLNEGLAAIYSIVEKSKQVWLLSHETTKWKLDDIMEEGLKPADREFRGIREKMLFATDAKNGDFKAIHKSKEGLGRKDTAYVVFNRPRDMEHVYRFIAKRDPAGLEKIVHEGLIQDLKDWFVTTNTVDPDYIALIYGYNGGMLYVREALSY